MPEGAWLLVGVNVISLVFAFFMQEVVDVFPCALCLWERYPFVVAAFLAFAAALWKPYKKQTTLLLSLCVVTYLVSVGLGFFHSGVELLWWEGTPSCDSTPLSGASPEELRAALLEAQPPRCDDVTWSLFGLSLANLNTLFSLGLALFSVLILRQHIKTR
ncbi:MAG: disulfide bond formation protein B [Alphaproteobacteria bacterium]|nr:disulfide bond formation protein B [Alphaproteobacteria bacterium]